MNPALLATLVVILAGGATALQAPTNARLASAVSSPVNAAFISFAVGTLVLGLAAAFLHTRPDMAATRALRERETGASRTPVLLLTANASNEYVEAGQDSGADGHLCKPVRPETLLQAVAAVISDTPTPRGRPL